MQFMTGTFKLISSENFDKYLKAVGVSCTMRRMYCSATPTIQIINQEDRWTVSTSTTFNNTVIKFKLGYPFDEITVDGRRCKSVITQEGELKLVHVQNHHGLLLTIVREFTDTHMKITLKGPGGIVSYRTYEKL